MSRPARTVALAIARTTVYYRRTAILAGFIGLGAVIGTVMVEETIPKAAALAIGVLFSVFAYKGVRASYRYTDPAASPVLEAISTDPTRIAKVSVAQSAGKPCYVILETDDAERLPLRIAHGDIDEQLTPLLDALEALYPDADVKRS
jgi:hypothetical protein